MKITQEVSARLNPATDPQSPVPAEGGAGGGQTEEAEAGMAEKHREGGNELYVGVNGRERD